MRCRSLADDRFHPSTPFLLEHPLVVLVAGIAAVIGRRAIRTEIRPDRTKQTVKEDVRWVKQQLRR
jgi:tyrosyl-tRNA synthetase